MKKFSRCKQIFFSVITIFTVISTLSGCMIIPVYNWYKLDPEEVSSIQVYDLYGVLTEQGAFLKTETPVYDIPDEEKEDFLTDLGEIQFSDTILIIPAAVDPSFHFNRWTVRINYTDGSYQLISCSGYGETYDANGEKIDTDHFGCDDDEWYAFIEKYVPDDIFDYMPEDSESDT